jgi:hypothetical protein
MISPVKRKPISSKAVFPAPSMLLQVVLCQGGLQARGALMRGDYWWPANLKGVFGSGELVAKEGAVKTCCVQQQVMLVLQARAGIGLRVHARCL